MRRIEHQSYDEERALYGTSDLLLIHCRFDGPADGESALKESRTIIADNCYFNLRYPFWHDRNLQIKNCELTEACRAALWYSEEIEITNTKLHGIKALRECRNTCLNDCHIISSEFGWFCQGISMQNTTVNSEYFMMRSHRLHFENVTLNGKYSFQYITDSVFENCHLYTKDAFWHAKNVVIRNSVVQGEYLAWYCENVTFENCIIIGTQPLCYCTNLTLINCEMQETDLAFEKSEVNATITTPVISIKNPISGSIQLPSVDEIIMNDPASTCNVTITTN